MYCKKDNMTILLGTGTSWNGQILIIKFKNLRSNACMQYTHNNILFFTSYAWNECTKKKENKNFINQHITDCPNLGNSYRIKNININIFISRLLQCFFLKTKKKSSWRNAWTAVQFGMGAKIFHKKRRLY